MAMQFLRSSTTGSFLKFSLLGLLGLSIVGLVLMDVGQSFTSGVGGTNVAKIENRNIGIREFDQLARMHLARFSVTPQQAYQMGYLNEILANEIRANFVLIEAEKLGINIGKEQIQKKIAEVVAPNVQEGKTPQQTLDDLLRAQNLKEEDFIKGVKRELTADILTSAVQSGIHGAPATLARDLYEFQNQTRDVQIILFPDSEIKDIATPADEQLKKIYEAQKETTYAIPEYRTLRLAVLNDENIDKDIEITDEMIKASYEENIENFKVGERHVITQAIAQSEEQAQKIYDLVIKDGKTIKAAAQAVMGKDTQYFEKIPFEVERVLPMLSTALEGKKIGDIIEPVQTPLGFQIIKLEGMLPPTTRPLEEVSKNIKNELLLSKHNDALFDLSSVFDDLLSSNTPLDEVTKEVPLTIFEIPAVTIEGKDKDDKNPFEQAGANIDKEKAVLLETAFSLQKGENSHVIELPSGAFVAIYLDGIEEKSSKPFDAVKADITERYTKDLQKAENENRVSAMAEEIKAGKVTFKDIAARENKFLKDIKGIRILGVLESPLTEDVRPLIFKTRIGESFSAPVVDGQVLALVNGYSLPVDNEATKAAIDMIQNQANSEARDEAFIMYLEGLSKKYTASINDALLKQVYGKTQDTEE